MNKLGKYPLFTSFDSNRFLKWITSMAWLVPVEALTELREHRLFRYIYESSLNWTTCLDGGNNIPYNWAKRLTVCLWAIASTCNSTRKTSANGEWTWEKYQWPNQHCIIYNFIMLCNECRHFQFILCVQQIDIHIRLVLSHPHISHTLASQPHSVTLLWPPPAGACDDIPSLHQTKHLFDSDALSYRCRRRRQ